MIRPTTKRKQREFIDALIDGVVGSSMSNADLLRHLRTLKNQLRNRQPVKRGDVTAQKVTPAVRSRVHAMYRQNRRITNQKIADRLNLNAGRVSEILAGKRR